MTALQDLRRKEVMLIQNCISIHYYCYCYSNNWVLLVHFNTILYWIKDGHAFLLALPWNLGWPRWPTWPMKWSRSNVLGLLKLSSKKSCGFYLGLLESSFWIPWAWHVRNPNVQLKNKITQFKIGQQTLVCCRRLVKCTRLVCWKILVCVPSSLRVTVMPKDIQLAL